MGIRLCRVPENGSKGGGATAQFAHRLAELWCSIVKALPDGGCALIITHGGIVEAGVVGCLPRGDFSEWEGLRDYCEGVWLTFDGENFVERKVLRVKT